MKHLIIAVAFLTSLCQAADQLPSMELKAVELQNLRALPGSKRLVDGTGKLVGKDLLIDNGKGQISFTPVRPGPETVYPRLCIRGTNCQQPVKPEQLPTLDELLRNTKTSSASECEPVCTDTEVCHSCPSPQYPADVCCVTKTTCTRCPGKSLANPALQGTLRDKAAQRP